MRGKDWKIFLKRHNGPKHSHHSLLIWLIRDMHTSKATASVKISRKEQMTIDKLVSGPSSSKIRRNGGPQVFGPFSAWFYRLLKHIPRYGTNRSFFAFLLCIIIDKNDKFSTRCRLQKGKHSPLWYRCCGPFGAQSNCLETFELHFLVFR